MTSWRALSRSNRRCAGWRTGRERPRCAARTAADRALLKSSVQLVLVEAADPGFGEERVAPSWAERAPEGIALAARADAKLDAVSVAVLRSKEGPGSGAPGAGEPGREGEARFARRLAAFESAIARDEIQNRYVLGRRVHAEFARGGTTADRDAFHRWVYETVFLTPRSDPWLGLAPEGALTGLDRGGVVAPAATGR